MQVHDDVLLAYRWFYKQEGGVVMCATIYAYVMYQYGGNIACPQIPMCVVYLVYFTQ